MNHDDANANAQRTSETITKLKLRKDLAGMVQANAEQFELRTQDHEEILSLRVALAERGNKIIFLDALLAGDGALITGLKNDLAEREAEIAKLRNWWEQIADVYSNEPKGLAYVAAQEALSTPPSTSYLEQWEKEKYGEPVAYINVTDRQLEYARYTVFNTPTTVSLPPIPLYARKEK
jgi:hypothetical protein